MTTVVTPADAGVQAARVGKIKQRWIPASAGMTSGILDAEG